LQLLCQCVEVEYIPHPDFRRRPFHRRHKHSETRFRNLRADLVGSAEQVWLLEKEFAYREQRPPGDLERLASKTSCFVAIVL
jgi:hypothetical protein